MENVIAAYFKKYTFLNLNDLKRLYSLFTLKKYPKNHLLSDSGRVDKKIYIVLKGLLRAYHTKPDGTEITILLAMEGMECGNPFSVFKNEISITATETIEDSIVLIVDMDKFDELASKFERINRYKMQRITATLITAAERIEFYTILSPEERYVMIQKKYPEMIQRVPQKYLASYIGVTPISLSRIKARLAGNGK